MTAREGQLLARRLAILAPTALLLAIAAAQMTFARTSGLSPWKGGGFGMFASVDGLPFRWIRLYVTAPDRSEELAVPQSLEERAHKAATWPHSRALQKLARDVIARERRLSHPVDTVRVEVWRADISPTLDVSEMLVCDTTLAAHDFDRENVRRSTDR